MTRNRFAKKNYLFVDFDVMMLILGKKIKQVREDKGFTISMVSKYSGVNRNTIHRLEHGECVKGMMLNNLFRIAASLDLSLSDAFFEIDYFCKHGRLFNGADEASLHVKE